MKELLAFDLDGVLINSQILHQEAVKKAVKEITTKSYKENRSFIENVKFFRNLFLKSINLIRKIERKPNF